MIFIFTIFGQDFRYFIIIFTPKLDCIAIALYSHIPNIWSHFFCSILQSYFSQEIQFQIKNYFLSATGKCYFTLHFLVLHLKNLHRYNCFDLFIIRFFSLYLKASLCFWVQKLYCNKSFVDCFHFNYFRFFMFCQLEEM